MAHWSTQDMPNLTGHVAIVTGASSGLGEASAVALARAGATVILAVRNTAKGDATRGRIAAMGVAVTPKVEQVDMAELASVRRFAERMVETQTRLDILLNNAGLMQMQRAVTPDGFERVFATNHLGHFALTGLLLPLLLRTPGSRVVTVSSIAHRSGAIRFDDLQGQRGYSGNRAYAQSKLANLLFALELDRHAKAARADFISVAAHPGVSRTGFMEATNLPGPVVSLANLAIGALALDAERGALPQLYAATAPGVAGGSYVGPDGFMEARGWPGPAAIAKQGRDTVAAARLWDVSKELTGVGYNAIGG